MAAGGSKRAGTGRRGCRAGTLAGTLLACVAAHAGPPVHRIQAPPPFTPAVRIPVEPLGFRPPSRFYLAFRVPSATLDFVDDTHLLFTFHQSLLMHRQAQDPADDEDQTIAAVLLALPGGEVVERTSWRMHDKGRYLWAIGHGRFLERERNTLYLLDLASGEESKAETLLSRRTPYLKPEGELVSLQLSPDRRRMVVEYREPAGNEQEDAGKDVTPAATAPTLGDVPRRSHRVRLIVIDTDASKMIKTAKLPQAVALPLIANGYLEVHQTRARQWKILLTPFGEEPHTITEVTSVCQPSLESLSSTAFLAQLCIPNTTDHLMQAWNLDGQKLWEQQWEGRYVWGSFAFAENGSRFAYESIQLDHPIAMLDPVDETSITGQPVGVYDVADGKLRLVSGADPILSAGQNYALSADGERFAVLRGGAIEVYKLPPAAVQ